MTHDGIEGRVGRHGPSASRSFAAALRGEPCRVIGFGAGATAVPTSVWRTDADSADHELLRRCSGSTVDIGCGPGRMTHALMRRGVTALGIDVVPEAVVQTRCRGGIALRRDVFSPLPREGHWDTALLADGNIGIGGDPVALLRRVHGLLGLSGRVVVDLAEPGGKVRILRLRLVVRGVASQPFPWAVVPADQVQRVAEVSALRVLEVVDHQGRWFASLEKQGSPCW